jgi:hypothetical protein
MVGEAQEETFTKNLPRGTREFLLDGVKKRTSVVEGATGLVMRLLRRADREAMLTLKAHNIPRTAIPAKVGIQPVRESSYGAFPAKTNNGTDDASALPAADRSAQQVAR